MWTFLWMLGCVIQWGDEEAIECIDNGECGEFQACRDDACVDVECLNSATCDIGLYCNAQTYTCVEGCLEDVDCMAGETCNTETQTCEAYGCRTTELDCPVGTECDVSTGSCDEVSVCEPCQNAAGCRSSDAPHCVQFQGDETGYCWPECGADNSCPAGFFCYTSWTQDICVADCGWLTENGYL